MGLCCVVGSDWLDSFAFAASCGWNRVGGESSFSLVIYRIAAGRSPARGGRDTVQLCLQLLHLLSAISIILL